MFNFESFSTKTYYGMLVASAGFSATGELIRFFVTGVFGQPSTSLFFTISYIIFGVAMLMLCGGFGSMGILNRDRGTQIAAMFLAIASLAPTPIPFGALLWPCFAFPYFLKKINPLYKFSLLVFIADFSSILFAFVLKGAFYTLLAFCVSITHLAFAATLFELEKSSAAPSTDTQSTVPTTAETLTQPSQEADASPKNV